LGGGPLGYNWQLGSALLGLEADASLADMEGTNTCFAYSGRFVSANCRARIDALGTLAGRFGWILPFDGRTLLFGKAGLAWTHLDLHAKPNGGGGLPGTEESGVQWGWIVGGGVERAIAPRWTLKAVRLPRLRRRRPHRSGKRVPIGNSGRRPDSALVPRVKRAPLPAPR
jgi:opacity protein-like surface antigen